MVMKRRQIVYQKTFFEHLLWNFNEALLAKIKISGLQKWTIVNFFRLWQVKNLQINETAFSYIFALISDKAQKRSK